VKQATKEYVESGDHLPACLRDFHDQKDVFKLMHRLYGHESQTGTFDHYDVSIPWTTGQCYVIDWFLWFMAQRGYTLQRSRAKVDFRDLDDEVKAMKEDRDALRQALSSRKDGTP
jgi:hypothetical protein